MKKWMIPLIALALLALWLLRPQDRAEQPAPPPVAPTESTTMPDPAAKDSAEKAEVSTTAPAEAAPPPMPGVRLVRDADDATALETEQIPPRRVIAGAPVNRTADVPSAAELEKDQALRDIEADLMSIDEERAPLMERIENDAAVIAARAEYRDALIALLQDRDPDIAARFQQVDDLTAQMEALGDPDQLEEEPLQEYRRLFQRRHQTEVYLVSLRRHIEADDRYLKALAARDQVIADRTTALAPTLPALDEERERLIAEHARTSGIPVE